MSNFHYMRVADRTCQFTKFTIPKGKQKWFEIYILVYISIREDDINLQLPATLTAILLPGMAYVRTAAVMLLL